MPAGAGVEVGLANSVIGIDYQLYIGGTPTGFPVSGTGLALSFGFQITPGVDTVVATDPGTSCVNNMTGSATVSLYPLPALHAVSGGGAYCAVGWFGS